MADGSNHRHRVRVRGLAREADGVLSVELEPLDGALPPGRPARTSTSSCPGRPCGSTRCAATRNAPYRIAVLREQHSRGGSQAVHERLRPGDVVRPRAAQPLRAGARRRVPLHRRRYRHHAHRADGARRRSRPVPAGGCCTWGSRARMPFLDELDRPRRARHRRRRATRAVAPTSPTVAARARARSSTPAVRSGC